MLANICGDDVPDEFWNRFYNLSSGEQYRMTNYEFEKRMLSALGLPGPEKIFEPQWFATRNFHGMWYTDADLLESYLHFRANIPVDEYFRNMKKSLPWFYSLAFLAPAFAVKMFMKPYAFEKGLGTQTWLRDDPDKLEAYYGSKQEYESIRSWDDVRPPYLEKNLQKAGEQVRLLEHGWDESKSLDSLSDEELEAAAAFRGGHFIRRIEGSMCEWECEKGHLFMASLEYVLLGGGWCLDCNIDKWVVETGPSNRFVSQLKH